MQTFAFRILKPSANADILILIFKYEPAWDHALVDYESVCTCIAWMYSRSTNPLTVIWTLVQMKEINNEINKLFVDWIATFNATRNFEFKFKYFYLIYNSDKSMYFYLFISPFNIQYKVYSTLIKRILNDIYYTYFYL